MRTSEAIDKLSAALVAAQAEMPVVAKTATNPHFRSKYATLDDIVKATGPVLKKHGLAVVQGGNGAPEGRVCITTRVVHTSGQWIESDLTMKPGRDDPQGVGACVTYGSRYGYRMLGVITDDDDDGNAATNKPAPASAAPASKATTKRTTSAPPRVASSEWFADYIAHMAKAKQLLGDAAYYKVLAANGLEHANEVKAKDAADAVLGDLRKQAKARGIGAEAKTQDKENAA